MVEEVQTQVSYLLFFPNFSAVFNITRDYLVIKNDQ